VGRITCTCGSDACKQALWVECDSGESSVHLNVVCKDGDESLMYLDANAIVRLITELRQALLGLITPPEAEDYL